MAMYCNMSGGALQYVPSPYAFQIMERLQEILEQGQREKNEKRKPKHMARKILAWAKKMRAKAWQFVAMERHLQEVLALADFGEGSKLVLAHIMLLCRDMNHDSLCRCICKCS